MFHRLNAIGATALCVLAGLYLLTVDQEGATVFEALARGIGLYFIGKGLWIWLTSGLQQRQMELQEKQLAVEAQRHAHAAPRPDAA